VLTGRCYEGDGAPPWWPWVQILRAAVGATGDAELREQLGAVASDVAELVPELRERFPGLATPSGPQGDQARFRLYDAIARFGLARAQRAPLVVILDDLHWADASSLEMVRFLAGQLTHQRILLVATYRDVEVRRGHPLADVLGDLARVPECERVLLRGLDAAEVAALAEAVAGERPPAALAERLLELTEGNPFFVREMVQLLADGGGIADATVDTVHALALPQGVRDAIGRRLDTLSEECNALLRAAAVIGREFATAVLEPMVALPDADRDEGLLELLGEALDAGVIVEAARGRYAFAHALLRQTLYEELRAPQRIVQHRRAGEALERTLGERCDEQAAELAHHFFEAAPGGDVDKAIHYCVGAAEIAHAQHAYAEAIAHRERALEAVELALPSDDARRAELLFGLGEELFTAGERDRARTRFHETAELARRIGRTDLVAEAAIARRGFGEMGLPPGDGDLELLEEALECLPEDAVARRARVYARLTGVVGRDMRQRDELSARSLELAERSGDPIALRDALAARWWATLGPDRLDERAAIALRIRELAERIDDPHVALLGLECELGTALAFGNADESDRIVDEYEKIADELRQPLFKFMVMQFRASLAMNYGDFDKADRLLDEAIALGRGRVAFAELVYVGQRHWSHVHRGEPGLIDGGYDDLDELLNSYFGSVPLSVIFSTASLHGVSDDEARERIASVDYRALDRDEHWLLAMGMLSDLAFDLELREVLEWLYEELQPYAHLMGVHDLMRASTGSLHACLGEVATGLGLLDEAIGHYEGAIERERAARMRPSAAQSMGGAARALLLRGGPGDVERARVWLAELEQLAAEMGTRHYERALEALPDRPPKIPFSK
jgi:tetratricopeptide (TPR) repeat protein